ncbi:MAG: PEP/pyruvate-binding domain-containing protein [Planctomycetota bacterium]|jgi:DNA-binding NarL/FixJ family response regulator
MESKYPDALPKRKRQRRVQYDQLMRSRVRNILLVSSRYDMFTFEEDYRFSELLISTYLELNLRYVPNTVRVATAHEALDRLRAEEFDLVISMYRVGDMDVEDFCGEVAKTNPGLPIVILVHNTREVGFFDHLHGAPHVDRVFVWFGDVRIFLAIIKYIEDRLNVEHDSRTAGVQSIILIEDNPRFYSSYLPMLYTELVEQTQKLMSDGINIMDRLLRMRARPKILLATSYEEGEKLFHANRDCLAGIITDASIPRKGVCDPKAGIDFACMVKSQIPACPILIQSSQDEIERASHELGAAFINKNSPDLLHGLRAFMQENLGFGDFIFRMPDGQEIGRASGLRTLADMIANIPPESLEHHAKNNDFSTWLMARTEFDLAKAIRPHTVTEFKGTEEVRKYLVEALNRHRSELQAGVLAEFSSGTFEATTGFVRIGSGSLGGKGRGLAFVHSLLDQYDLEREIPGVKVYVPQTAVLSSGVFEEFMRQPALEKLFTGAVSDREAAKAFLSAKFSKEARENLRTFLSRVKYPLAVRSSSLLEDSSYQPFAGVYRTYMIPNNSRSLAVRLRQLVRVIKLVYASVFFSDARSYISATPNRLEEERMSVVIQQIVGRRRGNFLYPDIAGVARSHNFYPMGDMKSEEGVGLVALGFGKTVVDGGRAIRFSPARPKRLYQFSSVKATLDNAQRQFLALDLRTNVEKADILTDTSNLVSLGLDVAEKDGVLPWVGSVYSPENDAIHDGSTGEGVRLVTMAGILKSKKFPLAKTLECLLDIGRHGFSSHVEIEFAANVRASENEPHEVAFLQIRPLVIDPQKQDVDLDEVKEEDAICISRGALGNGMIENIRDIVYVPVKNFDRGRTSQIAGEIGSITSKLREARRPFVLIGPGRWGTADRWLGIPVSWNQIAGAACVVETDMEDIRVEPSQGSHFFQNITSLGIGYLTVNFGNDGGLLDWNWLDTQPSEKETKYVRHLSFSEDMTVAINGRKNAGVIFKPGRGNA